MKLFDPWPVKRHNVCEPADRLHLDRFVPYRLSVLANIVSMSIAGAYERDSASSIPQWRVIAVLARYPDLSAAEVAERTAMDKVAVSRAVQGLARRAPAGARQRRRRPAPLAPAAVERRSIGIQAHRAARARYEKQLLDALSPTDRRALDRLLGRLLERARRWLARDARV